MVGEAAVEAAATTADVEKGVEEEGEEDHLRSPGVVVAMAMARVTPLGKSSQNVSPPMVRAYIIYQ